MQAFTELVQKQVFTLPSYTTVSGKFIKHLQVGWESYGQLNDARDNVVIVPHYFSGNSHVAGKYREDDPLPGYWDSIIGPGKAIDTDRFCVIGVDSLVNLNSKDGITITTGPASLDPATGKPYGMAFPVVTMRDFVRVQKALLDSLGIKKLVAAVGVSMGALQSYEWAAAFPDMVEKIIAINGTPSQRPFALCNLESWIAPIKADLHWNNGDYYGRQEPLHGVALALFNVAVAAQHPDKVAINFQYQWADPSRDPLATLDNDFLVNEAFKNIGLARANTTTDANHMLYMARANQLFIAGTAGSSVAADFSNIRAKTLVIQYRSDLLFPPHIARKQAGQFQENGTDAEFIEIDSDGGHIGGITEIHKAADPIQRFLA